MKPRGRDTRIQVKTQDTLSRKITINFKHETIACTGATPSSLNGQQPLVGVNKVTLTLKAPRKNASENAVC